MRTSRRAVLGLGALALLLPRRLAAGPTVNGRKFLFVFCPGGWDPELVFAPVFSSGVDHLRADEPARVGDLAYTASTSRLEVTSFLEAWGEQTVFINGVEVPSVAHDVCTRWTMTGDALSSTDDWVSIIAGHGASSLLMPNVHISGSVYPIRYGSAHVRLGASGQLASLLDGSALDGSDLHVSPLDPGVVALQDAVLRRRVQRWSDQRGGGQAATLASAELLALDRASALAPDVDALRGGTSELQDALSVACSCLERRLSRTATVAFGIGGNGRWDTHADLSLQDALYVELFRSLDTTLTRLASSSGDAGGTLLDETVVVVLSEMGRTPQLNHSNGKDHWTWTSAMLLGGGLPGGRTIGGYDDALIGRPVDLDTGEVADGGASLLPGHVGATLLALADVDPAEFVSAEAGEPIGALLV